MERYKEGELLMTFYDMLEEVFWLTIGLLLILVWGCVIGVLGLGPAILLTWVGGMLLGPIGAFIGCVIGICFGFALCCVVMTVKWGSS